MRSLYYCFLTLIVLSVFSCSPRQQRMKEVSDQELDGLVELMTGRFSSAEQAAADSSFYNIVLTMRPIWSDDKTAKWLYVEQAVAAFAQKPYRQRVYKVSRTANSNIFESKVFELPGPSRFIHSWKNPDIFKTITADSLKLRTGCSVFLEKKGACYSGSTRNDECKSTLRGASYATSKVEICSDKIVSWDQGWNDDQEQVWGAVKSGYIFNKEGVIK